jgi:hypothetical protein
VTVDATQLDELARRLQSGERRARDGSADLEVAAAGGVVGLAPLASDAVARQVGWALSLREQLLQAVRALAAVVLVVAQGYRATERQLTRELDALLSGGGGSGRGLPGSGLSGGWAGVSVDVAGAGSTGVSRAERWWAPVEQLLAGLRPELLEGLLVATPALARLVVDGAAPSPGSPAGCLGEVVRRAALLGPQQAAALVAGHLAAVPAGVRRTLALLHPALMTAASAAPASDRFAASRVLVSADLARLHERHASADPEQRRSIERRISWERGLLDEKVELVHPDGTTTRHAHQLLQFDPSGDGRIVEVIGALDRAKHVAVFVPGTGSDLDRYPGTYARMVPFAAASPHLAVVVWQDADHPDQPFDDGLPSVADAVRAAGADPGDVPGQVRSWTREHVVAAGLRDAADAAGPVLARDVAGLRAAAPGPTSDLTVLGHSYGGSIVGSAELHGLVADRVVHIASAGAYVDDVAQYPPTARRTLRFAMTAYDDPIRLSQGHDLHDAGPRLRQLLPPVLDPLTVGLPEVAGAALGPTSQVGHGLDPDLLPGVVRLDTGVHDDGSLVRGHSGCSRRTARPGATCRPS